MKKVFFPIAICLIAHIATSQNASVEKTIFGAQTGVIGLWVHNESKLSNLVALRSEFGFEGGIWGGNVYSKTGFLMAPAITIEPRFYYNLSKREIKGKRIDGNSGNFISLKAGYNPDWFFISNYDGINLISNISVVPTWGIRRNIGSHFNFETGFGIGYRYIFAKQAGYSKNESEVAYNFLLRIGYKF